MRIVQSISCDQYELDLSAPVFDIDFNQRHFNDLVKYMLLFLKRIKNG